MSNAEVVTHRNEAKGRGPLDWALVLILPILMVVMELAVFAAEPRVLSPRNVANILNQSSYLLTFRIRADGGHSDPRLRPLAGDHRLRDQRRQRPGNDRALSTAAHPIGSIVAAGLASGFGFGALVGLFNGIFVAWLEINPFVVTLGSLNICLGLATTISGGRPVFNVPDVFSRLLYNGVLIPGISVPLMLAVTVCLLLYFLLGHTVFGRSLYIIGSNLRAAYLAGLPKKGYLTAA